MSTTSRARYIRDEIWSDDWFYDLKPVEKLVWMFLLTNERNNVAGVFKLNRKWGSEVIGIEKETLDAILDAFSDAGKVFLHEDLVFIVNFHKHQSKSPKITAGIKRIFSSFSKEQVEVLLRYAKGSDRVSVLYRTLLNSTLLNLTLPNGDAPDDLDGFFEEKKYTDVDLRLAQLLADLIKGNNPDWNMRGKIETWAEHIEKLRRIDGRTPQQIEYMIRWVQADDFWQANILSTAKLREKFNNLIPQVKKKAVQQNRRQQEANKPKMV